MKQAHCFQVRLSESDKQLLKSNAQKLDTTDAEVVRKAIRILDLIVNGQLILSTPASPENTPIPKSLIFA